MIQIWSMSPSGRSGSLLRLMADSTESTRRPRASAPRCHGGVAGGECRNHEDRQAAVHHPVRHHAADALASVRLPHRPRSTSRLGRATTFPPAFLRSASECGPAGDAAHLRSEAGRGACGALIRTQRNDRQSPLHSVKCQKCTLTCGFGARGRIRTDDLPITSRKAFVQQVLSRSVLAAQVSGVVC
jgi:hypothetical protein